MATTEVAEHLERVLPEMKRVTSEDATLAPGTTACILLKMPDELLLNIIGFTGIGEKVKLRKTCHKLRAMTPTLHEQDKIAMTEFLICHEYQTEDLWACHGCLDLKLSSHFLDKKLRGHFGKCMPTRGAYGCGLCVLERRCIDCQGPDIVPGNVFAIDAGEMAKCWNCEQITCEFCCECNWCAHYFAIRPDETTFTKTLNVIIERGGVERRKKTVTSRRCPEDHDLNHKLTRSYINGASDLVSEGGVEHAPRRQFLEAWRQSLARERRERERYFQRYLEDIRSLLLTRR